jgi:uncharacterized membrane protein
MSDMPPPPPSQPGQPPMGGSSSAAGSNKNLYTILAWALFPPVGSLIFLFVGKDDPDVKHNAAAATVIHGGFLVVYIVLLILSAITVGLLSPLAFIWFVIWFIAWVVGAILAFQANGARVSFPVVGTMAEKYVPMVEDWAK